MDSVAVSAVDPYWDWDACCGGIGSNGEVHTCTHLIAFFLAFILKVTPFLK